MPTRKPNLLCMLGLALLPGLLPAQPTTKQFLTRYPPAVVNRMYTDYTSKMTFSQNSLEWLAEQYSRQDSQVADFILTEAKSAAEVQQFRDSLGWAIEVEFKKIMAPSELKEFAIRIEGQRTYPVPILKEEVVANADMNSQFGIAYKLKEKLQLTAEQQQALFTDATQLKSKLLYYQANPDSGYFDKAAFESAALSKILSEEQYNIVLAEKNKQASELQARYDWHALKAMGLADRFEHKEALRKMIVFYMLRAHITDRFAGEKEKQSALLRAVRVPEPIQLLRQGKASNKSQLAKYAW